MADFSKIAVYPIVILVLIALRPILTRGGKATRENGKTVFRSRPAMRVVSCFVLCVAVLSFCLSVRSAMVGRLGAASTGAVLALLFLALGIYCFSTHYLLDEEGLHMVRFWRTKTILWDDLLQYETLENSRIASHQYFFRAKGGVTIGVDELGHDAESLLKHVKANHALRHAPYQRRHWWGG